MQAEPKTARSIALWPLVQGQAALLRYALAGATGTLLHYALLFMLLPVLEPVTASTIGAIAGLIVNFQLAHRWVFRGRDGLRYPFVKFVTVALAGIGVNAAILSLMILYLPVLAGQMVATACVLLVGYVPNDLWSFGGHRNENI